MPASAKTPKAAAPAFDRRAQRVYVVIRMRLLAAACTLGDAVETLLGGVEETLDVGWADKLQAWVVAGYDSVVSVLCSADFGPGHHDADNGPPNLQRMSGAEHARQRALVAPAFSASHVASLRSLILERVDRALDVAAATGGIDVIRNMAQPLAMDVMSIILGIPLCGSRLLAGWTSRVAAGMAPTGQPGAREDAARALDCVNDYLSSLLAGAPRRAGLAGLLVCDGQLSHAEVLAMMRLLLFAGSFPTSLAIGNAVLALLQNPVQLQLLRRRRELLPAAIDESLRYDAVVQIGSPRRAVRRASLAGQEVREGDCVLVLYGSANHDESRFPRAREFDITRTCNPHLGFGRGRHACLAPGLAKQVMELAIGRLLARFPRLRLASEPERLAGFVTRGLRSLALSIEAGS